MNMFVVRIAAFVIGSSIAGCTYWTHRDVPNTPVDVASISKPAELAVFAGGVPADGKPGADVRVPKTGFHLEAAAYDTSAPEADVITYYRKVLAKFGKVTVELGGRSTHVASGFEWVPGPEWTVLSARGAMVAVEPLPHGARFMLELIDEGRGVAGGRH